MTSNGTQDSVISIRGTIRKGNLDLIILHLFQLGRSNLHQELDPMALHVFPNLVGAFAIKPTQQDTSNGNGSIKSHGCNESSALQTNIRSTDTQGLSRTILQKEHIVGRNGKLAALTINRSRTTTDSHQDTRCGNVTLISLLVGNFNSMSILESGKFVQVLDRLFTKTDAVLEIQTANVILNVHSSRLPVGFRLDIWKFIHHIWLDVVTNSDTKVSGICFHIFLDSSTNVIQFLGNTAHIDTGSSQSPLGSLGRWLDKITESNLGSKISRFLGCGHTTRSSSNHHQIVIVSVLGLVSIVLHQNGRLCFTRRIHESTSPFQDSIVTTQITFNICWIRISFLGGLGEPNDGTADMFLANFVTKIVPKAIIDQPLTKGGLVSEFVFDNLEAVGEKDREGAETSCNALVKAAAIHSCNMQDVRT
mmetsp:Transcript_45303/g.109676  ORF Transcript_45303/g.109676 Transcript_45303/m.109676 type:complete len:420 (-) Transcript_45303:41-1300(-)